MANNVDPLINSILRQAHDLKGPELVEFSQKMAALSLALMRGASGSEFTQGFLTAEFNNERPAVITAVNGNTAHTH